MSREENMIVEQADAIVRATRNVRYNAEAAELGWDDESGDFQKMAEALVDGTMAEMGYDTPASESYGEFLENDCENWYHWIDQTIGTDWGKVAKVIHEDGY